MGRQKYIQVLRIEDERGIGIFTRGYATNKIPSLANRHSDFPTPQEEGLHLWKNEMNWFCAYKSIEQIQKWILPKEFKKIANDGYRIYLLTITKYQMGEFQVIFPKENIKDKKDVTELFI